MSKKKIKKTNKITDVKKKAKAIQSKAKKKKPLVSKEEVFKSYGEPQPVKIVRPVKEYYNTETGEIYPKVFFRQDSWWDKIRRFFGYIP